MFNVSAIVISVPVSIIGIIIIVIIVVVLCGFFLFLSPSLSWEFVVPLWSGISVVVRRGLVLLGYIESNAMNVNYCWFNRRWGKKWASPCLKSIFKVKNGRINFLCKWGHDKSMGSLKITKVSICHKNSMMTEKSSNCPSHFEIHVRYFWNSCTGGPKINRLFSDLA